MKKFVGLILVIVLVLLLVTSVLVGADNNSNIPMIEVGSLACNKGDVVSVPIYISNNPGVTSVNLKIEYNSKYLKLTDVEDGKILGEAVHSDDYDANPYTLSWENDTSGENITGNGRIVSIKFRVAENTPAGRYDIFIKQSKQLNCNGEIVDFTAVSGAIDVKENLLGDANGDGVLDTKDRVYISRYVADWKDYRSIDVEASDVTCDGIVDSEDRMFVSRHLANWKDYKQFSYKSNGKVFKLKGVVLESSDFASTSTSISPYVMVNVTNGMGNKYGIGESGNEERKMYVGISGAENFIGREVLLFVVYNEFDDTLTIRSIHEVTNEKLTINIEDICDISDNVIRYYVDETKTASVYISSESHWYYNNVPAEHLGMLDFDEIMYMSGTIELSLMSAYTSDGDFDTVHITAYDTFVVDEVSATYSKRVTSKIQPISFSGIINFNEEDGDVKATLVGADGAPMEWTELEEYDVLSVKYVNTGAKDIYEAKVIENTVTGTVTGISGMDGSLDRYVIIDGTEYRVRVNAEQEIPIKLGEEGIFYMDDNNAVVYHRPIITRNTNYAYVIEPTPSNELDTAVFKVLTKENNIVDLKFASKITVDYMGEKFVNISVDNLEDLYWVEGLNGIELGDLKGLIVPYTLNDDGFVDAIEIPTEYDQCEDYLCMFGYGDLIDYNVNNSSFKLEERKYYITDDTVIFCAPETGNEEDFEVIGINDLLYDQSLTDAYLYDVDEDRNIGAIVVKGEVVPGTEEPPITPEKKNSVFVTMLSDAKDEEGYDVMRVTGYSNLEEVSYICEYADIMPGSLVTPVYDANGDVTAFNVIGGSFSSTDEYEEVAYGELKPYKDCGEWVSPINRSGKYIVVNGIEYKIGNSTNIYAYDATSALRIKYSVGEFIDYVEFDVDPVYGNADMFINGEPEDGKNVTAYLYIYDGEVVDLLYYID